MSKLPTSTFLTKQITDQYKLSDDIGNKNVIAVMYGMLQSVAETGANSHMKTDKAFANLIQKHDRLWRKTADKVNKLRPETMRPEGFVKTLFSTSPSTYIVAVDGGMEDVLGIKSQMAANYEREITFIVNEALPFDVEKVLEE